MRNRKRRRRRRHRRRMSTFLRAVNRSEEVAGAKEVFAVVVAVAVAVAVALAVLVISLESVQGERYVT